MKKITLNFCSWAMVLMALCTIQQPIKAETEEPTQEAVTASAQADAAAKQRRAVKTQVFINLLQKAQESQENLAKFIAYTLDWMQELAQSQDEADQELYKQLYVLVSGIVQTMHDAESQEDAAVQANQEQSIN